MRSLWEECFHNKRTVYDVPKEGKREEGKKNKQTNVCRRSETTIGKGPEDNWFRDWFFFQNPSYFLYHNCHNVPIYIKNFLKDTGNISLFYLNIKSIIFFCVHIKDIKRIELFKNNRKKGKSYSWHVYEGENFVDTILVCISLQ